MMGEGRPRLRPGRPGRGLCRPEADSERSMASAEGGRRAQAPSGGGSSSCVQEPPGKGKADRVGLRVTGVRTAVEEVGWVHIPISVGDMRWGKGFQDPLPPPGGSQGHPRLSQAQCSHLLPRRSGVSVPRVGAGGFTQGVGVS